MTRHLVVEGLIGVGKTSLCHVLARERGAVLVLEPSANNPFLAPYYADPERYALPVQIFYLIHRVRQQALIRQGDLFNRLVVSDYLFDKDRLFAEKTLSPADLAEYDRVATALGRGTSRPDLVVFLEAPIPVLLRRIARRELPGEENITEGYLSDLQHRYERFIEDYTGAPVLRIDNQDMNIIDDPTARQALLACIDQALLGGPLPTTPGSPVDREVQQQLFSGEENRSKK